MPPNSVLSGLEPYGSRIAFNVTADPGVISASREYLGQPTIVTGIRPAIRLTMEGDEWALDAARFIQITSLTPASANVTYSDDGRQHTSFADRFAWIIAPQNITRVNATVLEISMGPDPNYNPAGEELIQIRVPSIATRRHSVANQPH